MPKQDGTIVVLINAPSNPSVFNQPEPANPISLPAHLHSILLQKAEIKHQGTLHNRGTYREQSKKNS